MAAAIRAAWRHYDPSPHPDHERKAAVANEGRRHLFADEVILIMKALIEAPRRSRAV
ncbi:MAG: hypothetical protein ACRBM6_32180 [Geminicoccales bacterium]